MRGGGICLGGVGLQDDDGAGLPGGDALQVPQEVGRPLSRQHLQVLLVAQRPRHRRVHRLRRRPAPAAARRRHITGVCDHNKGHQHLMCVARPRLAKPPYSLKMRRWCRLPKRRYRAGLPSTGAALRQVVGGEGGVAAATEGGCAGACRPAAHHFGVVSQNDDRAFEDGSHAHVRGALGAPHPQPAAPRPPAVKPLALARSMHRPHPSKDNSCRNGGEDK